MIFQENDFLKTYDSITRLWESPVAVVDSDIDIKSEVDLTSEFEFTLEALTTYMSELNFAFKNIIDTVQLEFPSINMKGVTLFFEPHEAVPNMVGPFMRQQPQDSLSARWEYVSTDSKQDFGRNLKDKTFDLSSAWLGFYFFTGFTGQGLFRKPQQPSSTLLNTLIVRLAKTFPQFNWADCQFTHFTKSHFKGAYGFCVKCFPKARYKTLASLTNVLKFDNIINGRRDSETSFDLQACIQEICETSPTACIGAFPEKQSLQSLQNTAFYVPALVKYYETGTSAQKSKLAELLFNYYGRMTISGGKNSLQYLYNAGVEETQLAKSALLERNSSATRLTTVDGSSELAYQYLVPKIKRTLVSQWNGLADFLYGNYTVDAKIYKDVTNMWEWVDRGESLHNANYLIVYLIIESKWLLLGRRSNRWVELSTSLDDSYTDRYAVDISTADFRLLDVVKNQPKLTGQLKFLT